jgi:hypothetical protein
VTGTPAVIIHEVDLVQTDVHGDEHGTLYVDLTVGDRDMVRVYRNFPAALYEEWMHSGFDEDVYRSGIESIYPYVEENDAYNVD